jgi:hypothetical protein
MSNVERDAGPHGGPGNFETEAGPHGGPGNMTDADATYETVEEAQQES